MARGQGRAYRPTYRDTHGTLRCADTWWIDYTTGGQRHREPTDATTKSAALDVLRVRVGDRQAGKIVGRPDRVVLAEYVKGEDGKDKLVGGLRALVERQYALDGRKSVARVQEAYKHLEAFFGAGERVANITKLRVDAYAESRLAAGRARATVNNELAQLRRGFRLGIEAGLLAVMPVFKLPKPHNARSGFFETADVAALMLELPADARRDLVQFLRLTGWRRDEGRLLQWAAVDMDGETIRLEEARSKSGRSRVFPFHANKSERDSVAVKIKELLADRWAVRDGLYVFPRDGQPIGVQAVRHAWAGATKRAGLAGRLIHDLRRTAARDFRRAGVDEGTIMRLCGWETRSMFDRYNVIDEHDLASAVAKRDGKVAAKSEAPAPAPAPLSSSAP